jgi:Kef-type K+ transport system membrane component KefB
MYADNSILLYILELLAAAVIAIPIFHRLGLGSVLGYLVAGAVLGMSKGLRISVRLHYQRRSIR